MGLIYKSEIRLEIYGCLLLARIGLLPLNTKTAYSVLSPVVLSMIWHKSGRYMSFSTLGIPDHCKKKGISWSIHPAILSTCRTVHEEARTVLYGKNGFFFGDFPVGGHSYNRANHESVFLEQGANIFKYNEKDWRRSDGPFLLSNAPFARFLNKIGARNAASLKVVELSVDCRHTGNNALATDLLMRHVPALETLRVFVYHPDEDYDRDEDHVIRDDRDDKEVAIQRFCRTLRDLVRGRSSLEVFDYGGSLFGPIRDLEARPGYSGNIVPLLEERKEVKASDTDSS